MTFLYPSLLFGLAALAIPIIVHLFNFRRAKKIYFSNTELLKDVKEVTSSKRRLKHYLILASRLLFLFFLILAFAQPFIPASESGGFQKVNIYVDNSLSMLNQVVEGQTSQDLAVSAADEIIKLYPEKTQFKLLDNGFSSASNLYYSQSEIEDRITELSPSPVNRSLDRIVQRMGLRENERSLNYIISDFQKSTLGELENIALDSQNVYYLLPVQGNQNANIFIDTLFLVNPFIREGEVNRIVFRIRNTGNEDANDLLVKLHVNEVQAASTGVNIPANSNTEASFELNFSLEEINSCRISFEEFPVSFDNDFYFTLNLTNQVNVLEIKSASDVTAIEKVFGNPSLFNFSSYQFGNLDYSALERADLVVLNQPDLIDPVLLPYLNRFLGENGHLLLIPSANPDLASYRSLVPQIQGLNTDEVRIGLSNPDKENPFFFNIFEDSNRPFNMPEARPFVQWLRSGTDLLKFRQGAAFLSRLPSRGSLYMISSPLDDDFTNFHKHALFVPVMYRMAVQSKSQSDYLYHTADQELITLYMDSLGQNDIFKLRKDQEELIPEQRIIGQELIFEMPSNTLTPGFYELILRDEIEGVISINADKKESLLDVYPVNELEDQFSGMKNVLIRPVDNINSLANSIKEEQFGVSLWKYCLFLALLFLLAEILLIKFL